MTGSPRTGDAPSRVRLRGLLWAVLGLAIAAAYPVVTRLGVTGQGVTPLQLVALRYGIAGLLLLPVLVAAARTLAPADWAAGALLAALQGTPLALLVAYGLKYTPAAHGAALTLGLMPAAILVVGGLAGARAPRFAILGAALIAAGAVALSLLGGGGDDVLLGHAMLVTAAFLGAGYFVRLRRSGFTALQGAAFVAVFSGVGGVVALLVIEGPGPLMALDTHTLLVQAGYQGVLAGVVWTVATNRSIALLGAAPSAVFLSLVPGLAALLAIPALGEIPRTGDALALAAMGAGAILSAVARGGFPTVGVPAPTPSPRMPSAKAPGTWRPAGRMSPGWAPLHDGTAEGPATGRAARPPSSDILHRSPLPPTTRPGAAPA